MVLELNYTQSKAVDIVERLIDMDSDLVNIFIPIIFNFDGVAEYIVANYSDVLEDDPEGSVEEWSIIILKIMKEQLIGLLILWD